MVVQFKSLFFLKVGHIEPVETCRQAGRCVRQVSFDPSPAKAGSARLPQAEVTTLFSNWDTIQYSYLCPVKFLIQLLISTIAVIVTAYILPGVEVDNFLTALMVAAVLAFLNSVIRPLFVYFTLPLTFYTFGIFLLVINAFMVMLADKLIDGFSIRSFWTAFWFSIILWLVTQVFEGLSKNRDKE